MCVSAVWTRSPDGRLEKIADDVLIMRQEGPLVVWRSYLGESFQMRGSIQEIDTMKHTITLLAAAESGDKESPATYNTALEKSKSDHWRPDLDEAIHEHEHSGHSHKH